MTCVHKVRWSVKRPEDCRFRLSVSHYKDRIVAPDEYSGVTAVTPSDSEQVLPTKDKLVRDDITVMPVPEPDLRPLSVSENGQYSPDGFDGFSQVNVDVPDKVLISESVLERDIFDTDAKESYWIKNFIPIDQNEDNLYEIVFQNNTAPTRTAVRMICLGRKLNTFSSANGCFLWRMSDGVVQRYCTSFDLGYGDSSARFLNASAGTIVKVYKLRYAF